MKNKENALNKQVLKLGETPEQTLAATSVGAHLGATTTQRRHRFGILHQPIKVPVWESRWHSKARSYIDHSVDYKAYYTSIFIMEWTLLENIKTSILDSQMVI